MSASSSSSDIPVVVRSSSTVENVDSIILVYDLDRVETFFRLENHWLPLIERCYSGKASRMKAFWYSVSSSASLVLAGSQTLTHFFLSSGSCDYCRKQGRSLSSFQHRGHVG
jgi:hypothetical protein